MRPEPGTPADWLRYARSDLALARLSKPPEVLLETLCFHAQQAVEKSLKAILLQAGTAIPRTHNLEHLIDLLPARIPRTAWLMETAKLSGYATGFRYPADEEELTVEEYDRALQLAETILTWAEKLIKESTV